MIPNTSKYLEISMLTIQDKSSKTIHNIYKTKINILQDLIDN